MFFSANLVENSNVQPNYTSDLMALAAQIQNVIFKFPYQQKLEFVLPKITAILKFFIKNY